MSTPSEAPRAVHLAFAEQAARTPGAPCLVIGDTRLSYAAVDAQANRLAWLLRARGVTQRARVALLLPRGADAIVAMLAVLKANAVFVPLDPAYPPAHLAAMVADSAPACLVADATLLGECGGPWGAPVVTLAAEALAAHSPQPPPNLTGAEDAAYVMYTSGSTGQPKGVVAPHRAILRLVLGADYAHLSAGEVILQLAPLAFDASTFEIWGSLLHGAQLAILPEPRPTLDQIAGAITRYGVTTAWLTAGLFHLMVDHQLAALGRLRQLLAGGDVLSPTHARKLLEAAPLCRLVNGYGPTENTTFTCCHTVTLADLAGGTIPIGRPIAGTTAYVLDAAMHPVPDGAEGQLCTGGAGVALGYLGQPALTAERFVPDPAGEPGAQMYLTGDLVRRRADGALLFLGRLDRQVKINGRRVEVDAIELALRRQPGVRDAAVLLREDTPGRKRIVAYVTGSASGVMAGVRSALPDWMVPAALLLVPELPLNANGKVDRARLPPEDVVHPLSPLTDMEQAVAAIWQKVLGVPAVSREANFFDLGATSLQVIEAHASIQRHLAADIGLVELFQHPSISQLAARLTRAQPAPTIQQAAALRASRGAAAMARARAERAR